MSSETRFYLALGFISTFGVFWGGAVSTLAYFSLLSSASSAPGFSNSMLFIVLTNKGLNSRPSHLYVFSSFRKSRSFSFASQATRFTVPLWIYSWSLNRNAASRLRCMKSRLSLGSSCGCASSFAPLRRSASQTIYISPNNFGRPRYRFRYTR
jgi:hypothetical protein